MLNQLANENSQLKKTLEDKSSETIGIKNQKTNWKIHGLKVFQDTYQLKFLSENKEETDGLGTLSRFNAELLLP